jgi:hypothetical protein
LELDSGRHLVPYIWLGGLSLSFVMFAVTRSQICARETAERSAACLRILVVDDEPDTLELIIAILEQYGAQVTAVTTAREALEALTQNASRKGEANHPRESVALQEYPLNAKFDVLVSDIGC